MSIRKHDGEAGVPFVHATHEALFEKPAAAQVADDGEPRCDACGARVEDIGGDEGFAVSGRGVYLWTRGDEARFEDAPLCAACASAIGMSALARWEIEEEEG